MAKAKEERPGISFAQLQANLSKGNVLPVYVVYGADEFIVGEAAKAIVDAVAAKAESFNKSNIDGAVATLADVLDSARTQDLFSPFKVLIVSPADKLLEKHAKSLASYVETPAKRACLILLAEKTDKRWKITKQLNDSGGLVIGGRIYEREIPSWIVSRAKSADCAIDRDAAQLLTDFLGEDLATIASEIQKLAAYVANRRRITVADVEAISLRHRMQDIFKLIDAIGARQTAKILPVLDTLLEQGERPTGILYMVARHIRQLWAIHELVRKGFRPREAALSVTHNNYVADKCTAQLERFTLNDLRRNTALLIETEAALKSSQQDDQTLLEMTFIKLTQPRRQTSTR